MGVHAGNIQVMDDDVEMIMKNCPITFHVVHTSNQFTLITSEASY